MQGKHPPNVLSLIMDDIMMLKNRLPLLQLLPLHFTTFDFLTSPVLCSKGSSIKDVTLGEEKEGSHYCDKCDKGEGGNVVC